MERPKLRVEQLAEQLIAEVALLLAGIPYHCSACKHLAKSADAVLLNLGEGVVLFRPRLKANKYDIARGEANEVRKALRSLVVKRRLTEEQIAVADDLADHIIGMLTNMIKNLESRF
jgi:four helix bundle protein